MTALSRESENDGHSSCVLYMYCTLECKLILYNQWSAACKQAVQRRLKWYSCGWESAEQLWTHNILFKTIAWKWWGLLTQEIKGVTERLVTQLPRPSFTFPEFTVSNHIRLWYHNHLRFYHTLKLTEAILQKLMLNLEKPTEIPVCGLGNPLFSYMWASKFLRGLHTCIVVFAKWLVFLCVHFYSGLKNCLPRLWFPIFYMFVILKCVRSNQCTY